MPDLDPGSDDPNRATRDTLAGFSAAQRGRPFNDDDHDDDPPDRTSGRALFVTVIVVIGVLVMTLALVIRASSS
ncbi:MAG: hypothetical protein AAF732_01850 [Pseudomonadota bacterium]